MQSLSLTAQMNLVFSEIENELAHMDCGTLIIQIRDDTIGKFGLRHDSLQGKGEEIEGQISGMNERQRREFRKMAIRSLQYKKNWTHGEMIFDFRIKDGVLYTNVQFESNYNLAKLLQRT